MTASIDIKTEIVLSDALLDILENFLKLIVQEPVIIMAIFGMFALYVVSDIVKTLSKHEGD